MKTKSDILLSFKGGKNAFAEQDWIVRRGEQWIVTGENSSGKTYLAKMLSSQIPLCGATLERNPEIEPRDIQLVTVEQQNSAAPDWMQARWHSTIEYNVKTVDEVLTFNEVFNINPFEIREPEPEREKLFALKRPKILKLLKLDSLLDNYVMQLSNGEMRRMLLATALLKLPKILILDDPYAGLDPKMQTHLHKVFNALAKDGITLILMIRHADEIPQCTTHHLQLNALRFVSREKYKPAKIEKEEFAVYENPPSLDSPEVLAFNNISITYANRTVFKNFSWHVHAGERWLITGPNGCGKSTLISLITGDNPQAYACDIKVFGKQRGKGVPLWSIRSRIGHISPEMQCSLNPLATTLEAVLTGCVNEKGEILPATPTRLKAARFWLKKLGLENDEKTQIVSLSAGCVRLVLVARALMPKPDILLLDELCMNLDETTRNNVMKTLEQVFIENPDLTTINVAHRTDDVPPGFNWRLNLGKH